MNKAVIISIRPKWCELIALGKKTVEVRKTAPKLPTPYKSYIYETIDSKYENIGIYAPDAPIYKNFVHHPGKVIGEYLCDEVEEYARFGYVWALPHYMRRSPGGYPATEIHFYNLQLSPNDLNDYGKGKPLYGLHISDLVIYDKPRHITDFKRWNRTEETAPCAHVPSLYPPCAECKECNLKRPPQSWCYVEEL